MIFVRMHLSPLRELILVRNHTYMYYVPFKREHGNTLGRFSVALANVGATK